MIITMNVKHNELSVPLFMIDQKVPQHCIIGIMQFKRSIYKTRYRIVFPNIHTPGLIGGSINRTLTRTIQIDLKSRPMEYDTIWNIADENLRERIFFAQPFGLWESQQIAHRRAHKMAIMDGSSYDRRFTAIDRPVFQSSWERLQPVRDRLGQVLNAGRKIRVWRGL